MKKKLVLLTTATLLAFNLVACSDSANNAETATDVETTEDAVEEDATEEETVEEEAVEEEATEEEAVEEEATEEEATDAVTLQDYYADPEAQEVINAEIATLKEANASTFSDITLDVVENELIYTFTLVEAIEDVEAAAESMKAALDTATLDAQISSMEASSGISGISICYIYNNPDGSEICTINYPEAEEATEEEVTDAEEATEEEVTDAEATTEEEATDAEATTEDAE